MANRKSSASKKFPQRRASPGWLRAFHAHARPVAAGTLLCFAESALAPAMAWAHPDDRAAAQVHDDKKLAPASDSSAPSPDPASAVPPASEAEASVAQHSTSAGAAKSASKKQSPGGDKKNSDPSGAPPTDAAPPADLNQALALPTGADKTGVTGKAISLPQGSGKIQGMGESFSAQLSTGIATFSVPFSLPHARGGAQPALGLSYSSGGGFGLAGVGWDVGVPFIARQTDRGVPSYNEQTGFNANQDRFVFNGGQELVPICVVGGGNTCAGALPGELMPAWSVGAQYFRPRVEGSFLRFFWSPDHKTWRVQDKSGVTMELGVPLDGSNDPSGLDTNPSNSQQIYRWHLVRQYDSHGDVNPAGPLVAPMPKNVVVYRYFQTGGTAYLSDIFDTTPSSSPVTTTTSLFAHHTRLSYEDRSDPTFSYRSGWRMDQTLRLTRVDVTSRAFNEGLSAARHQVRRYHLGYALQHASLLTSVQVEGRCDGNEVNAPAEVSGPPDPGTPPNRVTELLRDGPNCPTLPAMTFDYSHVQQNADLPGFEGFNHDLHTIQSSPPHSVDDAMTDLLDIDSDGLPDVLNTSIGTYGYGHGVFFNSVGGKADSFGAANLMSVQGVLGANANTITFQNLNLAALDLDGDGTINLLHMPQVKTYSSYSPVFQGGAWSWVGRAISTSSGQSPKIDFGKDAGANTKVMDVNGDGLVDVVVSTGTDYETFLSLGRLPAGDGQFGNGSWATASSSTLSNEPIRTCVPWSSTPVQLSDPDVQLADMNGDGLPDIVRVRRGDIRYWPGRGNGVWGTGDPNDCKSGSFSSNGYISMGGPQYSDTQGTTLRMDDVNGDGLDDLVQVNFDSIDIYLNVDGKAWTDRHIIPKTPASPSYAIRVRLLDVNGSGTRDILWGNGNNYQYIDLEGGQKSFLLTHVENGLGKSTDIDYSTSTAEMLAAESLRKCDPSNPSDAQLLATSPWGCAWTMKMPTVAHVVKRVTESDNLAIGGAAAGKYVTEYQYRDPLFEGRQREFRGFTRARSKRIGDTNSPSDFTESAFLLGECEDETPSDGVDNCSLSERWRDNPREALKGLPVFTEKYDENGVYLSTDSSTYRLRQLYMGLDGRAVRQAFESAKKTLVYDTATGPQSGATATLAPNVYLETSQPTGWDPIADQVASPGKSPSTPAGVVTSRSSFIPQRASAGAAVTTSASDVDFFGNKLVGYDFGCSAAAACATPDGALVDETIVHVTKPIPVAGDAGGWLWRTGESWVTGSVHQDTRSHTTVAYNAAGDPTTTQADLHGVVALDRFASVNGTAPVPGSISTARTYTVSSNTYDTTGLGLLIREEGALSRCRDVSYGDDIYAEFATIETIHTSGGCASQGIAALSTAAVYDRGFGAPTSVVDMQLQPTSVAYDSFGRLTELTRPPTDGAAAKPSVKVSYTLPSASNPVKFSVIHTQTQDGASSSVDSYLESYSYVDGLGRTRLGVSEADPRAHDGGAYIVSGVQIFDAKSAVSRKYLEYFTDSLPASPPTTAPTSAYGRQRYDAFGRQVQTFDLDGTVTLQSVYHALSSDLYDAADLENGPHQGSYASMRSDGHGRTIVTTERAHLNGAIDAREVRTQYLATGEPEVITRVHVGHAADPPVVRWMRYDSLGHMVLNVDPHTSQHFDPSPSANATPSTNGLKAWRYAYDDAGDLVGTSDARGCGENFEYDGAGRILTEDYSPCGGQGQTHYSLPTWNVTSNVDPSGYEVVYHYDTAPAHPFSSSSPIARPANYKTPVPDDGTNDSLRGRLVATWSIGKTQWNSYDARGRVIQTAVIPALPLDTLSGTPGAGAVSQRYGRRAYYRDFIFDAADREVSATTGSTVPQLQGTANASAVTTEYSNRGTVKKVGSSYGDLVTDITRTADGLVTRIVYGDAAATATDSDYDARRRLRNVQTYRGPPNIWNTPTNYTPVPAPNGAPSTFQLVLQDQQLTYDVVGNPTEIQDFRTSAEWPAGSKPVTKKIQYDDLYRATRIDYQAAGGTDAWTSPFAAELAGETDPRRVVPGAHVAFDSRPLYQTFSYDWLGNTQSSDDDAHGFYDRSLGTITNDVAGGHPYQLKSANNKSGPATTRNGQVDVAYDAMGNISRINLERNGPCLPAGSPCSSRWDLQYDEVGRLSRIFRADMPTASLPPIGSDGGVMVRRDLRFLYDESDERIVKSSTDTSGVSTSTLYPYETLEVRGTAIDPSFFAQGYAETALTADNEVPYLVAHGVRLARVHDEEAAKGEPRLGTTGAASLHVLLELGDQLGSTDIVIDKATSELVEASTYQGYGAKESDYRPERWKGYRDDYGFTGKEEDAEFGTVYFGKRFYSPFLNRWITADPLAVHGPGQADLNLYAYVNGTVLRSVDPLGLANGVEGGAAVDTDLSVQSTGVNAGSDSGKPLTTESIAFGALAAGALVLGGPVVAAGFVVGSSLQTSSDTPTNDPKELAKRQNTAAVGGALMIVSGGGIRAGTPTEAPLPPRSLATQLDRVQAATDNLVAKLESGPAATQGVLPATEANAELRSLSNPNAPTTAPGGSPQASSAEELPNFANQAKLDSHFGKHGPEFAAKSPEEYLGMARDVMQKGVKVKYTYKGESRTGYVQFMGNARRGTSKFAFVGTNAEGNITTFHVESGKSFWKMLNGDPRDTALNPAD
jgi:RHS repeat-associated protein